MSARPRIVFMGTPAFAVPSLEACLALGDVVCVLTRPDRPSGRGQKLQAPPVKERALQNGLTVLQPQKLKGTGVGAELAALQADVCVVTAYGRILPPDVLASARMGCVNVHGSLLPRWRGAAPIQWAIASGDRETGVTLMKLDEGLDTGPTFASRALPIEGDDTSETLHAKLADVGGALLREMLPGYLSGERIPRPQPGEGVTHAPPIEKEQGRLDFSQPAEVLERRIRAFTPWPGAFTQLGEELMKVKRAALGEGSGPPGTLLAAESDRIDVACASGALRLLRVQPAGRREMSVGEFLASRRLDVGSRPFQTAGPERSA